MIVFCLVGCSQLGATNTKPTNVAVTSYETIGVILTQAYTAEKAMCKSKMITPAQDKEFQLGVYAKAVAGYKAVGTAAVAVLTATDSASKKTAQEKFNELNAQLPGLIADVTKFIQEVQK
jgi:hypothetical protein